MADTDHTPGPPSQLDRLPDDIAERPATEVMAEIWDTPATSRRQAKMHEHVQYLREASENHGTANATLIYRLALVVACGIDAVLTAVEEGRAR